MREAKLALNLELLRAKRKKKDFLNLKIRRNSLGIGVAETFIAKI